MRQITVVAVLLTLLVVSAIDPSYAARDKSGVLKAKEVIGTKVVDTQGKKLGDIKELVLEPYEGKIQYAVLDFGGFLGIGDKYFAVPWVLLKMSPDKKAFILDLSKKDLKKAPGFDKRNWPDMNDPKWYVTIYEYYEVPQPGDAGAKGKGGTP